MSTLKVDGIRSNSASSDAITLASDGTCTANITNNLSNRNLIINGAMQVAQRGTSASYDTNGWHTLDRFLPSWGGIDNAITQEQAAVTSGGAYDAGFRNCLKITNGNQTGGAGASDYIQIATKLEAQDIANSGWNYTSSSSYITLSFWIKSSVAQAFSGSLRSIDGTAYSYKFDTPSLSANTWTKVTKTIPGNSNLTFNDDNGHGLTVYLYPWIGTGSTTSNSDTETWVTGGDNYANDMTSTWYTTNDATFELTGVQLEVGSVATDFEHRSYAQELALCRRYCYVHAEGLNTPIGNGTCWSAANVFIPVIFPVKMRTAPSLTVVTGTNYYSHYYGGTSANESGANFSLAVSLDTGCEIYDNSTNVTQNASCFSRNQNAACKIILSAEI